MTLPHSFIVGITYYTHMRSVNSDKRFRPPQVITYLDLRYLHHIKNEESSMS